MTVLDPDVIDDLRVAADPAELAAVRGAVREAAETFGFCEGDRRRCVFVANEAVANAIEHGTPCDDGSVGIRLVGEGETLAFYVSDCGDFQPGRPDHDLLAERGRGLALMAAMADDFEVLPDGEHTVVKLSVRRPRLA